MLNNKPGDPNETAKGDPEKQVDQSHTSDLSLVILNWNSAHDSAAIVASLPAEWRDKVVVVDNDSDDWESERSILTAVDSRILVVRRADNGGYAAGMNTGMVYAARSGSRYALLINADSRPSVTAIEQMLVTARKGSAIVGIAQLGPEGSYPTAARGSGLFAKVFTCAGCKTGAHEVDIVSGAAVMVDLQVAHSLNWMDERFFHYYEEIDFCLRARNDQYRISWLCNESVPHAVGGSLAKTSYGSYYYRSRNKILLMRKHATLRWVFSPRLYLELTHFFLSSLRVNQYRASVRGVIDGFKGVTGRLSR